MAHRNKTLRGMSPTTRKVARLTGELESVARRLENALTEIAELEHDSQALHNHVCQPGQPEPQRIVIDGKVESSTKVFYSLCESDIIDTANQRDPAIELTEAQLDRIVKMVESGNSSMESIEIAVDEVVGESEAENA